MINSVKIDSILQKHIFCQKNDLIKSSPGQLLKKTLLRIYSLVAVFWNSCTLLSYSYEIILNHSTGYFVFG